MPKLRNLQQERHNAEVDAYQRQLRRQRELVDQMREQRARLKAIATERQVQRAIAAGEHVIVLSLGNPA